VPRFIKICELEDVPPGRGKVVHVGGREVYVCNREGRIFATAPQRGGRSLGHEGGPPPVESPAACRHPGSRFEVEQEDSPVRVRAHGASLWVRVEEDGVYAALDEEGAPLETPAQPAC
jgi:hypothetical protein